MDSVMAIAASGLQDAIGRFGAAASNLVNAAPPSPAGPNPDLAGQMVAVIEARAQFGASLAVFKAADRMTGRLIDQLA